MIFPHFWALIHILTSSWIALSYLTHLRSSSSSSKTQPKYSLSWETSLVIPSRIAASLKYWTPTLNSDPHVYFIQLPQLSVASGPGYRGRKEHKPKILSTFPSLVYLSALFPSTFSSSAGLCFPGSCVICFWWCYAPGSIGRNWLGVGGYRLFLPLPLL